MKRALFVLFALLGCVCVSAEAQITIGVSLGETGPGASIGIPNKNVIALLPQTIAGKKVNYIVLDDATDPTQAVTNARRLITSDNVDIIIGSSTTPTVLAMANVAGELKTPEIAVGPVGVSAAKYPWLFDTALPLPIMMQAVVEHMKTHGVKTVAYIGFSDAWGDLVYSGFASQAEAAGIKIVDNERYARPDTSVTGQVLKILSFHPDAVVVGGSGTPGALPQVALYDRGYKGFIYHSHGVVNKDFIRVGGKAVEGAIAPVGPVLVAEQLPDSNPIKKVALRFIKEYESAYGPGTRSGFASSTYDAYLLIAKAVPVALKKAKPGTPEFRRALRDALETSKEVVGSYAVYNMTPTDHAGVDSRARVLVHVENGEWKLLR